MSSVDSPSISGIPLSKMSLNLTYSVNIYSSTLIADGSNNVINKKNEHPEQHCPGLPISHVSKDGIHISWIRSSGMQTIFSDLFTENVYQNEVEVLVEIVVLVVVVAVIDVDVVVVEVYPGQDSIK
ncbi:1355_t:CDS:2 [Diversispora eburnea]|uniref:1355_t:CDS:1 n=1 Tax=Diversispora eburnea TaxID=1213867 RepID=A0A9N8YKE5_9GLOM|nr:1355_t:CDS:2 [Diversispora eburnea]